MRRSAILTEGDRGAGPRAQGTLYGSKRARWRRQQIPSPQTMVTASDDCHSLPFVAAPPAAELPLVSLSGFGVFTNSTPTSFSVRQTTRHHRRSVADNSNAKTSGNLAGSSTESRAPKIDMSCSTAEIDTVMETARSISLRGFLRLSALMLGAPSADGLSFWASDRILASS
jgi:hypothetical protein